MIRKNADFSVYIEDMKVPIRILIVENQTLVKIGIKTVLSAKEDFEIVGETDSGAEGFQKFRSLKPDVTILSLRLPDSCAIDTLDDYFTAEKHAKILVLADTAGDAEISKALKKGALGYICKDISPDELVKAIRVVADCRGLMAVEASLCENTGNGRIRKTSNSKKEIERFI